MKYECSLRFIVCARILHGVDFNHSLYSYFAGAEGNYVKNTNSIDISITHEFTKADHVNILFTKRQEVLQPNLVKSRSREIWCYNDHIVLGFDTHLDAAAAEVPVKYQSDRKGLKPNFVASKLHKILR